MTAEYVTLKSAAAGSQADFSVFPGISSFLIFNSSFLIFPMCADCAGTRISRALRRDKCAFRGGEVRQRAVKCDNFSREAFNSKNSSFPSKTSQNLFLAMFLRGLSRVISTNFKYTRARGNFGALNHSHHQRRNVIL